jgi:hypothetical protein
MRTRTNPSTASLMCCLLLGPIAMADLVFGEEPVYFADANLKACVERQLGVSNPTPTDMQALTSFRPDNCGIIIDFTGLEYAKNLEGLEFDGYTQPPNIAAIAGLTNLKHLSLCSVGLSDISPIAGLTNLTELHLSSNRISDISAVADLTKLAHLDSSANQINDISAVSGLTKLTILRLSRNRITDISAVSGLTKLTELSLYENQITDISATAGLRNVARLSLHDNQISDISAVAGLTNLTYLHLQHNQIIDISPLLQLTSLRYVDLRYNPLSQTSCEVYIRQIQTNNPDSAIYYSPYVQRRLTVSSTLGGSVAVPGEGVFAYEYDGVHPVTARADPGYHFMFWTGTAVDAYRVADSMTPDTTVALVADYTLIAHFAADKGIIYVDDDAIGSNDGSSWADAYTHLQDALTDANNSPKPVEIRVAQGIYRPDQGVGIKPGDRQATFGLLSGFTLKGGYAGSAAPDPNARARRLYETILSGDLDGDDTNVHGYGDDVYDPMWTDNSFHVVTAADTDASAVLDGFRVSAGYSIGYEPHVLRSPGLAGGGMVILAAGPTLIDCDFTSNAANRGGALAHSTGSSATLVNCTFEHNYAFSGGAVINGNASLTLIGCRFLSNAGTTGVGIYCGVGDLTVSGCEFENNVARYQGGGLFCDYGSRVVLRSCFFTANSAQFGGAMNVGGWPPGSGWNELGVVENCIFAGNTAAVYGGGIAGSAVLTNCTLTGNRSPLGTTVSFGAGSGALVDCILWDNLEHPPVAPDSYQDPLFAITGYWVDPNDLGVATDPSNLNAIWIEGDYHLKSQTGRWEPTGGGWVKDDVTSPYIDAGDATRPVGDEPYPNGGIINMGAYGGTNEASMSFPGP